MNRKEAAKKAKELYGPTADAVRVSSKDRNQRFGVMLYEPGGLDRRGAMLICLGYGKDFETAFDMAASNEVAKMAQNRWKTIQEQWEQFGKDPKSVLEQFRKDFENHGYDQRAEPEGVDHQPARGEGVSEGEEVPPVQGGSRDGDR